MTVLHKTLFYCGYNCDTTVNNVIAHGPDGIAFFCALSYPGSWADSSLMAHFLSHIKKRIGNFKICVDKRFSRSGSALNVLLGPYNNHTAWKLHPHFREYVLCIRNVYTLLRQASEWGMRGMQGSFP